MSCRHKVKNIRLITGDDEGDKILLSETLYRFRGKCTVCGHSIVAKEKSEYDN